MRSEKGFSLLELLITVAVVAVISAIAIPLLQQALLRAHVGAVTSDARALHTAFKRHYVDLSMYPDAAGGNALQLDSFAPLSTMDYYTGGISEKLAGSQADAYDSPDDQGLNQEFWLEITLEYDPTVRFVIADSDDAPLSGGDYLDGVYLYRNGVLKPLEAVNR